MREKKNIFYEGINVGNNEEKSKIIINGGMEKNREKSKLSWQRKFNLFNSKE